MNQETEKEISLEQGQAERLLDALHEGDRKILFHRGFRVLKDVCLKNCVVTRKSCYSYEENNSCKRNVEETKEIKVNKKQMRKSFLSTNWTYVRTFSNKRQAQEILRKNTCWKADENDCRYFLVNGGRKVRYKCIFTKPNEPSCEAEICLFYHHDTDEVSLEKNDKEHTNHDKRLQSDNTVKAFECKNQNEFENMEIDSVPEGWEPDNIGTELIVDNYANLNTILKEELIIMDEYVDTNAILAETDGQSSVHCHPSESFYTSNDNAVQSYPRINGYVLKEIFPNMAEAINALNRSSNHWALTVKRELGDLQRTYFRCNYTTSTSKCPTRVILLERLKLCDTLYYQKGSHYHSTWSKNSIEDDEIIISDESNMESLNSTDGVGEWIFEKKFDDYKSATDYMQKLNLVIFEQKTTKNGIEEYYNCKLVIGTIQHCPASRFLHYTKLTQILLYNRHVQHVDICVNAIPPLVPIQKKTTNITNHNVNDNHNRIENISTQQRDSLGVVKQWVLEKRFDSLKNAKCYVESAQIWSYKNQSTSKEAIVIFYHCNAADNSAQQCSSAKFIYFKTETNTITVYKTVEGHTCSLNRKITPEIFFDSLNDSTKNKLQKLVRAGHPPDFILEKLELDLRLELHGLDVCFRQPLYDWIRKMQRELPLNNSEMSTSMEIIEDWLIKNNAIPKAENEHQPYCVSYFMDLTKDFRFFWSTRCLLKSAVVANSVHIDSTCLLNWHRKPITIIGTTDVDQKFHLFGIAVTSHRRQMDYEFMFEAIQKGVQQCHNQVFRPEYLISDDNRCVHGAFHAVFSEDSKIGTSPKEALNRIALNLSVSKCDIPMKDKVRLDILKILQLSSRTFLLKALELFYQKWRPEEHLTDFLNCVRITWLKRISNWFQVFPHFKPDTSKAIRHEYVSFKISDKFHHNLPLESFQSYIIDYIENLSGFYARNGPKTVSKTTAPILEYKKAVQWQDLKKQYKCVDDVTEIRYYIPTEDEVIICEEKFQKYLLCNHQSLEEFFEIHYSFWCVTRSKNSDALTCSCPYFWDNLVCQHSIGMGLELKLDLDRNIKWIY